MHNYTDFAVHFLFSYDIFAPYRAFKWAGSQFCRSRSPNLNSAAVIVYCAFEKVPGITTIQIGRSYAII